METIHAQVEQRCLRVDYRSDFVAQTSWRNSSKTTAMVSIGLVSNRTSPLERSKDTVTY